MAIHKYIYWRNDMPRNGIGQRFANIHLLVGYNLATISDFHEMAAEMRETFPQAIDDKVRCGKVHESSFVRGFSLISFDTYLPDGEYPGWVQVPDGKVEYYW